MTDPTPSAPTAEMLAQDFERAHKAAGYGSVRWNVERTRPLHLGDAERFVGWKRALAALARSEPPTAALDEERRKFQAETRRTSELTRLLQKWVARHEQEHGAGPWSRDCDLCALVGESKALMDRPINEPPTEGKIQAVATQRQPIVPYGRVTTHSVTGQQFFYRWPDFPYLDNASECVPVYLPTPVASEGDSLLPASQPTEPPTPPTPGTAQWCAKCGEGVVPGLCRRKDTSEPPTGEPVAINDERIDRVLEAFDNVCIESGYHGTGLPDDPESIGKFRSELRALLAEARAPGAVPEPIDMVLHCPACGLQHIDAPEDEREETIREGGEAIGSVIVGWDNPPHRSHLCHDCGHVWRPADVPTNGVAAVKTKGKADSPPIEPQAVASRLDAVDSVQEPKP
jgi:hypothetical protein